MIRLVVRANDIARAVARVTHELASEFPDARIEVRPPDLVDRAERARGGKWRESQHLLDDEEVIRHPALV